MGIISEFSLFHRCAELIDQSSGLLIAAGAGMGVDSGLPDFRGAEGLWRAYPPLREAGLCFEDIANPQIFKHDPGLAWGFYGHRLLRYREVNPHSGFTILLEIAAYLPDGVFVFTSNVDGHFQKAGFAEASVFEVHGSIHYLQCTHIYCSETDTSIWSAAGFRLKPDDFDMTTCRLAEPAWPKCPNCWGEVARPNVLMFGDCDWESWRSDQQEERFRTWCKTAKNPVVIELGAGKSVPTVRRMSERTGYPLIRINLHDPEVLKSEHIGVPMGALAALKGIRAALVEIGFLS
jgi:NAD-dependent SIR2 family protein deacetylase